MISLQQVGSVNIIRVRSSFTGDAIQECRQQITDYLAQNQPFVVLNLNESGLINSEGLELIVDSQTKCLGRGGKLVVAEPQQLCAEILDITGVSDYVAVFPDMRSALSDFTR